MPNVIVNEIRITPKNKKQMSLVMLLKIYAIITLTLESLSHRIQKLVLSLILIS